MAPASTPGGQAVAWIGGGQKLGPIYVATLAKDLYLPGGTCPPVGIGGHAQGGGRGMAHRGLGMLIDHALSVEVVTTDGRVLNASATNQYADLFWAVRGGGANYGIVTRWQMRLDPVPESVTRFTLSWNTTVANLATALLALDKWAPWNLSSSWGRVHFNIMVRGVGAVRRARERKARKARPAAAAGSPGSRAAAFALLLLPARCAAVLD